MKPGTSLAEFAKKYGISIPHKNCFAGKSHKSHESHENDDVYDDCYHQDFSPFICGTNPITFDPEGCSVESMYGKFAYGKGVQ